MYNRIIGNEIYLTPAYIAYVTLSYQEAYGNLYNDLSDIFKPAYVPHIQNFRDHVTTTNQMNLALILEIYDELGVGVCRPKTMFKDSVLSAIIANEDHPFRVALRDNDLFDWTPQAPTRLYYCTADEQVPYQNAIVADSVMQENGAPDVAAVNFGNLSHGGCADPAIDASIAFFDSFVLSSSVDDASASLRRDLFYPNPSDGRLFVFDDLIGRLRDVRIIDASGKMHTYPSFSGSILELGDLPSGYYIIEATNGVNRYHQRIIIRNR
jgi:hypothetical protein